MEAIILRLILTHIFIYQFYGGACIKQVFKAYTIVALVVHVPIFMLTLYFFPGSMVFGNDYLRDYCEMGGFHFFNDTSQFNISHTIFSYFFMNNDSVTKDVMVSEKYMFDRGAFSKLVYRYSVFHYLGDINFKYVTFNLPKDIDFYNPINMLDSISIMRYFSNIQLYIAPSGDQMRERAE